MTQTIQHTIQHSSTLLRPIPPPQPLPKPLDVSKVEGVEPQVNQFKQVSSDDHQMSGAEGGGG